MPSTIKKIRTDFPIFTVNPDWAYLDTSATSHMPQTVLDAMAAYHCGYRASVHRGMYKEAVRATEAFEGARVAVAGFIGANPDEIVFTAGATASSNMLAYALEHSFDWHEGDEIVTTIMEHHASLVPLQELAKRKKLVLKHIPLKGYALDYKAAEALITNRTKLVSVMLASNVLGTINNVARIAKAAHDVGAIMVCDATAAVGHLPVSVHKLAVDFMYFSGHKMCGPTGVGVLYGTRAMLEWLHPSMYGGAMIESVSRTDATWTTSPQKFEPGTPNVAGVIGFGAAVEYLTLHTMQDARRYVEALMTVAYDALVSVNGVHVYAAKPEKNVGVLSFTVDGVHPHDMAEVAASEDVAVRAGHHCAMPLHTALGVPATVRASLYLYSTKRDIDALITSIKHAQRIFNTVPRAHAIHHA
jgi:cysteine desulfurase/selenocysteine lyase